MEEFLAYESPGILADVPSHFCPGCHHGIVHKLLARCLEEKGLDKSSICVASIGCSAFIYEYVLVDTVEAPHGRAPAVATGIKRSRPESFVFAYQGDGDLASIGLAEIMHAANRGERVCIIYVNNTVYGMTGGQMAPTTMVGQKTTTTPEGRSAQLDGDPMQMTEMVASMSGVGYAARVAVNNIKNLKKAQKALHHACEVQMQGLGLGFVEFLASCPTNWRMNALDANARVAEEMIPCFPLGVRKNVLGEKP